MSTVMLVENQPLMGDGLRRLLEQERHQVVAEASNRQDALRLCREHRPEVVIIDLEIAGLGGLDMLRRLRSSHGGVKLVVYSAQEPGLYAARSRQSGADAFVSKFEPLSELKVALAAVLRGHSYFPREVARLEVNQDKGALQQLSERELTVLQLLGQGLSNKDIAAQLSLSYKTVSTYKARLHEKLAVSNDFQLLEILRQYGLADEEPVDSPTLNAEQDMLRALLDAAPSPMFVRDLQGRLLMCNRLYLAHADKSFADIRDSLLEEASWVSPALRQRCSDRYRDAVQWQEPFMVEGVLEEEGAPITVYVWCLPYRNAAGDLIAMLGGMRYLSERDDLLIELRHQGAEAQLLSQLKSQTLVTVRHAVAANLAVLQAGLAAVVQQPDKAAVEQAITALRPSIEDIHRHLEKLDELLELDDAGVPREAHDLGRLSADILAPLIRDLSQKGCSVELSLGAFRPAWINARQYQQLLESALEHLQRTLQPAQALLHIHTNILPRGYVCLSVELSPWPANTAADNWAYARLQRLLLLMQARVRVAESVLQVEIDLPAALSIS